LNQISYQAELDAQSKLKEMSRRAAYESKTQELDYQKSKEEILKAQTLAQNMDHREFGSYMNTNYLK
jgi:hypothetical protein